MTAGIGKTLVDRQETALRVFKPEEKRQVIQRRLQIKLTLAQSLGCPFQLGNINPITDDIATGRAVFDHQQPAAIAQLLLDNFAIRMLMLADPLFYPGINIIFRRTVLPAFGTFSNNFLKACPGHDQVTACLVKAQISLVTKDQAIVLIVNREPLGKTADRLT